jgi:hypothetical protein
MLLKPSNKGFEQSRPISSSMLAMGRGDAFGGARAELQVGLAAQARRSADVILPRSIELKILLLIAAVLFGSANCANHTVPREPPQSHQLWFEERCFAHVLPAWKHLATKHLAGSVVATDGTRNWTVPMAAQVYVRQWPHGQVARVDTDAAGEFAFPNAQRGVYEVAACLLGFNPWRGTIELSPAAPLERVQLEIELGQ